MEQGGALSCRGTGCWHQKPWVSLAPNVGFLRHPQGSKHPAVPPAGCSAGLAVGLREESALLSLVAPSPLNAKQFLPPAAPWGRAQRERRGCLPGFEEGREEEGECFGNDPHTALSPTPAISQVFSFLQLCQGLAHPWHTVGLSKEGGGAVTRLTQPVSAPSPGARFLG